MEYLVTEKIIRLASVDPHPLQTYALTAKAFSILNTPADGEDYIPAATLGHRLAHLRDHAAKSAVASAIGTLFKLIAG